MKFTIAMITMVVGLLFAFSLVWAQMLAPKHPGYPMDNAKDPVSGQSLANDPGQTNAGGAEALAEAGKFDDVHTMQSLEFNRNDERYLEKPGAGLLPKVQGPQIEIEPPVEEATRMQ
jgi:hypothetical protein